MITNLRSNSHLILCRLPLPHVARDDVDLVVPHLLLLGEQRDDGVRVLLDCENFDLTTGHFGGAQSGFNKRT